jgi:hypothetical protein
MLVDLPTALFIDLSKNVVALAFQQISGTKVPEIKHVAQGIYDNTNGFRFNFIHTVVDGVLDDNYDGPCSYGVADNWEQVINHEYGEWYIKSPHRYVMSFETLRKKDQHKEGWRWHKWGEYIGKQEPKCEYLADEPIIEEVITFRFNKVIY